MGSHLPGTKTLGWEAWCGARTPCSWDIPPEFLSTTHGCGTSPFYSQPLLPCLDGCGFLNSVVIRLPFNSIFDGSVWWLFRILVMILLWLWEDVSHVYLCCNLDWKFNFGLLKLTLSQTNEQELAFKHLLSGFQSNNYSRSSLPMVRPGIEKWCYFFMLNSLSMKCVNTAVILHSD